ncbi:MAG: aspartate carbamoyltransferase regulatory subunit [Deltaproteobacteria bacterium]|nr:aspartate carbamoyltransferase regulatory subunit [Deltaproteobacteria bacterium]
MSTDKNSNPVLHIPKIEEGFVFDHIPAGLGPRVLELLRSYPELAEAVVTVGLNYRSGKLGSKDMLKIEVTDLPESLIRLISLVGPGITIKKISGFEVVRKLGLELPDAIDNLARCRNPNCVTNTERHVAARFERSGKAASYRCLFCERVFDLKELELLLP